MPEPTLFDYAPVVKSHWPSDLFQVAFVPLTRGKFATVDLDDLPKLFNFKWAAELKKKQGKWYASAYVRGSGDKNRKRVSMHRLISGAEPGEDVDHHDNNGLNNRRQNLRRCERTQNHANRHLSRSNSGFKGVSYNKGGKTYEVRICKNGIQEHLGCFKNAEDAARAYDKRALELFGEFAHLNFPDAIRRENRAAAQVKPEDLGGVGKIHRAEKVVTP